MHEILIAAFFLAMIAAPAYVTSTSKRDKRDTLWSSRVRLSPPYSSAACPHRIGFRTTLQVWHSTSARWRCPTSQDRGSSRSLAFWNGHAFRERARQRS